MLYQPVQKAMHPATVHSPPCRVGPQTTMISATGKVGEHVDFAERRLVQADELSVFESGGFLCTGEKVTPSDAILLQ